jgi:hypothetical protein
LVDTSLYIFLKCVGKSRLAIEGRKEEKDKSPEPTPSIDYLDEPEPYVSSSGDVAKRVTPSRLPSSYRGEPAATPLARPYTGGSLKGNGTYSCEGKNSVKWGSNNPVGLLSIGTIKKKVFVPTAPSFRGVSGTLPDAIEPQAERPRSAAGSEELNRETTSLVVSGSTDPQFAYVAREFAMHIMSGLNPGSFSVRSGMDRDQLFKMAVAEFPEILGWNEAVKHCSLTADKRALRIVFDDLTVSGFFILV